MSNAFAVQQPRVPGPSNLLSPLEANNTSLAAMSHNQPQPLQPPLSIAQQHQHQHQHQTSAHTPQQPIGTPSLNRKRKSSSNFGSTNSARRIKGSKPDESSPPAPPHLHTSTSAPTGAYNNLGPPPVDNKKRNKLGYQRNSVACGHCRRRKIRCLIASEERHGRCSNCVRLKKECTFYPVDQNPRAGRTGSACLKKPPIMQSSRFPPTTPPPMIGSTGEHQGMSFPGVQQYQDMSMPRVNNGFPISPEHHPGLGIVGTTQDHIPQIYATVPPAFEQQQQPPRNSWDNAQYTMSGSMAAPVAQSPLDFPSPGWSNKQPQQQQQQEASAYGSYLKPSYAFQPQHAAPEPHLYQNHVAQNNDIGWGHPPPPHRSATSYSMDSYHRKLSPRDSVPPPPEQPRRANTLPQPNHAPSLTDTASTATSISETTPGPSAPISGAPVGYSTPAYSGHYHPQHQQPQWVASSPYDGQDPHHFPHDTHRVYEQPGFHEPHWP